MARIAVALTAMACVACSGAQSRQFADGTDCTIVADVERNRDALLSTMGRFPQGDADGDAFWNEQLAKYGRLGDLYGNASDEVSTQRLSESLAEVAGGFHTLADFPGCDSEVDGECLAEVNAMFSDVNKRMEEVAAFCPE